MGLTSRSTKSIPTMCTRPCPFNSGTPPWCCSESRLPSGWLSQPALYCRSYSRTFRSSLLSVCPVERCTRACLPADILRTPAGRRVDTGGASGSSRRCRRMGDSSAQVSVLCGQRVQLRGIQDDRGDVPVRHMPILRQCRHPAPWRRQRRPP